MKKVQFTETILRDANQSLVATRLGYSQFEPILKTIDQAGFYSVECWGGATFDVCLRFLNEDPWERLRKIRAAMPNTKPYTLDKAGRFKVRWTQNGKRLSLHLGSKPELRESEAHTIANHVRELIRTTKHGLPPTDAATGRGSISSPSPAAARGR